MKNFDFVQKLLAAFQLITWLLALLIVVSLWVLSYYNHESFEVIITSINTPMVAALSDLLSVFMIVIVCFTIFGFLIRTISRHIANTRNSL